MSEKSNYPARGSLSPENIRKLEDIRKFLPAENIESANRDLTTSEQSIILDETAKNLPVTEFPESKPLEINSIHLDETALLRERAKKIDKVKLGKLEKAQPSFADVKQNAALLSEKEKEELRNSDDYRILAETNQDLVKDRVKPDPAVDALFESIFKEKPVDPLVTALFLFDQEKKSEHAKSAPATTSGQSHQLTKELAGESAYYENLRDVSGIKISPAEQASAAQPESIITSKPESKEVTSKFNSRVFEELCQWSIKGMSDRDIRNRLLVTPEDFKGPEWIKKLMTEPGFTDTVNLFLKQRRDNNFKPAALLGAEIILENINSGEVEKKLNELNLATEHESEKKLREIAREIWDNFVFTAKKLHNPETKKDEFIPDLDSKVAIWLFEKAGIRGIDNKKLGTPGKIKVGSTMIDVGVDSGVRLFEGVSLNRKNEEGVDLKSRPTALFDNHLVEKDLIESSATRSVFSVLRDLNLLKLEPEQFEKAKLLVEMTVLDDNASMINNREQFENSAHTLRGLHRYFKSGEDLYQAVSSLWEKGMTLDKLLDKTVPEGFDKKYKLGRFKKDWQPKQSNLKFKEEKIVWVDATADQQSAIEQAQKIFGKSEEELRAEGRLLESKKLGKCLVFINDVTPKAGHDAVKAYFGENSSYMVFSGKQNSFLVNSHNKETQLNELYGHLPQGIFVRGNIFIKPPTTTELLKVSPKDLILPLVENEKEADDFLARVHNRKSGKIEKKVDNKVKPVSVDNIEPEVSANDDATQVSHAEVEQSAPETKTENWVDADSGIEFTRTLTGEEIKLKTAIDDLALNLLITKAQQHHMYKSVTDKGAFEEKFISDGFKHPAIVNYLKKEYLENNLPVK